MHTQALKADMKSQRAEILARIRAKKREKAESEYEAHAAAGMVMLAQRRLQQKHDREQQQSGKHKLTVSNKQVFFNFVLFNEMISVGVFRCLIVSL